MTLSCKHYLPIISGNTGQFVIRAHLYKETYCCY